MIELFKDVTSEDPVGQIWKLLRFFLDIPSVSDKIRSIQGITARKQESNVKKQAKQIGYCIRQAEEYFHASSQVKLPTRPTLLYYGAVSLSRALVLLRQDGTHSFDALRKSDKHNHHGLDLDRGLAAKAGISNSLEAFLKSLQCMCHTNNGDPWGHFSLFYRSLVPSAFQINQKIRDTGKSAFLEGNVVEKCADLLPLNAFISKPLNALDILKTLPDMYFALRDSGIRPDLCEGNVKMAMVRHYLEDEHGNKQLVKIKETHDFSLDGLTLARKEHFLAFYKERNPNIMLQDDFGENIYLRLNREYSPSEELTMYYPDIAEDISGRKFYILKPETYITEPAAHLVLLYCLGMLSRYYPDIWMRTIDENVQISELADTLLNIIYRKFPNLILDQMTWVKHYIHP